MSTFGQFLDGLLAEADSWVHPHRHDRFDQLNRNTVQRVGK